MKFDYKNATEEDLWKYIGKHLADNGIDAVLVGGVVVLIHIKHTY